LCAPSGTGYTYLWSGGGTSRCKTVNCAGTYTVTVTNSNGCSSTCSAIVSYTNREASVQDIIPVADGIEVNAYPNPFTSNATIEFQNTEANSHLVIELYSSTGNKIALLFDNDVEQGITYKAEVNAGNLAEGIYIYRITNGDLVINRKLILMK
jgi:hypothetical protein